VDQICTQEERGHVLSKKEGGKKTKEKLQHSMTSVGKRKGGDVESQRNHVSDIFSRKKGEQGGKKVKKNPDSPGKKRKSKKERLGKRGAVKNRRRRDPR